MTPRLLRSSLTGRVYIVTRYRVERGGYLVASRKYDVTDDYNRLAQGERAGDPPGTVTAGTSPAGEAPEGGQR